MKQIPSEGSTNIRCHHRKLSHLGNLAPEICASLPKNLVLCRTGTWHLRHLDLTETDMGLEKMKQEFKNFK